MKHYKIDQETIVYHGFLKVLRAKVSFEKSNSNEVQEATRECLERGDSVAVLIHHLEEDAFIFTKQFRYPSARRDHPWMLELVAGSIDKNESAIEAAQREALEEVGYHLNQLQKITQYFPSPGGCSEQIHLYYAAIGSHNKTARGGGNESEKEDIEIVIIKREKVKKMLLEGAFNNSISLIGLQWFFLHNP